MEEEPLDARCPRDVRLTRKAENRSAKETQRARSRDPHTAASPAARARRRGEGPGAGLRGRAARPAGPRSSWSPRPATPRSTPRSSRSRRARRGWSSPRPPTPRCGRVVRRLVRRYAPPPSKRPAELPADRTMFDLPPLAVLPLDAGGARAGPYPRPCRPSPARSPRPSLDRPRATPRPAPHRRWIRDAARGSARRRRGRPGRSWRPGRGATTPYCPKGTNRCSPAPSANAGHSDVDGLPLVVDAAADDGLVEVAVAVPVLRRRLLRSASPQVEVRRARGRAMSVTPHEDEVPASTTACPGR